MLASRESRRFTYFSDFTESASLVSVPPHHQTTWPLRAMPPDSRDVSLSVSPQVRLQSALDLADPGAVAGHHEGDRRQVRQQRPHLLPVPQVAPPVQRFLLLRQLLLHHNPGAGFRPLAQRACERELQGAGDTHRSSKWPAALIPPQIALVTGVKIRNHPNDPSSAHLHLYNALSNLEAQSSKPVIFKRLCIMKRVILRSNQQIISAVILIVVDFFSPFDIFVFL